MNHLGDYDVIVIGAGHAGIEAAHAAATLGAKTAVFTMSLDAIGNMPCNPSIGGTAKGTLVRELDALGGVMGLAADATYLQSRMLNKGKGPAVHALRVQTDRKRYHEYMKHALELTPGLAIHQAEVVSIEVEQGRVKGVVTQLNGEYGAKCVVIATGTNLGGKIFVGDAWYASGPDGMHAANALTESLKAAGLPLRRFKTGTPARVHRRSIDFSQLECQPGDPDSELQPFSFLTDTPMHNKVECWIAYTNPTTHKIILDNIQRSPLYGGMIEGVGPRYCPSIEDKVVRFAGKERHPIFVEPCGENTEEMYLQGASSSLPEDVQNAFYRSIKGFEHIEIMRPAYAIEYDCVDPTSLEATLESKHVRGLYGAGQFNGTSGYEEAAAQGLLAGLNAARNALGKEQLILPRHTSYLGTLVDDLVTKGVMDPYRMMTSRSEYRLTLRQDNADQRLTPIGREYGLVQDDRWAKYQHTQNILEAERRRLHETHLRTAELRADKVVRFAGKERHPIFVEPCGENTEEMYLQGASSSLPEDVQNAFYRSIKGFEHIEIMRPAYAIEYDCVDPTSLEATLESKHVRGLYGAGQFNGTSGYEEAAAQGLLAGLNAARNALGKEQLILPRHTSYLGTLVDDLVTKGVMDPYRMMTSRSEYRLTLRQDNADQRLTPIGREYGLVQDDRWAKYQHTQNILEAERRRLHETHLRTAELRAAMEEAGLAPAAEGGIAEELLRRPEISYPLVAKLIGWGEGITPMLAERLETEIKYAGYIARQDRMIRDVARHEKTLIPEDFCYENLTGLTLEAREKLSRIRPKNLGQAGRIPGVSPSDVAQLSIALAARPLSR